MTDQRTYPQGAPSWVDVETDDVEETDARIQAAGGKILRGPEDGGPGGRSVLAADPAGVEFRLWQAHKHLGAQTVNEPRSWNFSGLRAANPSASARFYIDVFGWELQDAGEASLVRRSGYGEHLRSTTDPEIFERQAAIGDDGSFADAIAWVAPAGDGERPHWHVSFSVADRDAIAARAEELGGNVIRRQDADWTLEAKIRDPRGAEFTVSQFLM